MSKYPMDLIKKHSIMENSKQIDLLLYFIILTFLVFGYFFERLPGFGWDGNTFANIVKGGSDYIFNNHINQYRFTRIFPAGLIGFFLRIFNFPLNQTTIVNAFIALNVFSIFLALYYWIRLSNLFQFNTYTKLFGFIALFLNFPIIKLAMFYPALTDIPAFTMGLMLIYFYFKGNKFALLSTTVIGAFTFPTLMITGLLFFIFPYHSTNRIEFENGKKIFPFFLVITYLLILCFLFLFLPQELAQKALDRTPNRINHNLILISIVAFSYYIFHTSSKILSLSYYSKNIKKYFFERNFWIRVGTALFIFFIVKVTVFLYATHEGGVSMPGVFSSMLLFPIESPFIFILAHILYFGPIIMLLIVFWNEISVIINSYGLAFNLLLLFAIFLSINSESRQLITFFPLFILAFTDLVKNAKFNYKILSYFFVSSLIFSRFWFKIWSEPMFGGSYFEFPWQRYFMIMGPWMSEKMFYIQGTIVLISFIFFYLLYKKAFIK